jgi:uncharacterized repeat protein (TIGR03806 family)
MVLIAVCSAPGCGDDSGPGGSGGPRQNAPFGLDQRPVNTTCLPAPRPPSNAEVALERVFPGVTLERPVLLLADPARNDRFYVVEQTGRVQRIDGGTAAIFVDISGRITGCTANDCDERGLLGMALAPDFAQSGRVYLSYTGTVDGQLTSIISRFRTAAGGATLDPASEQRLLQVAQPFNNHNGGNIAFGPDGFLYIGLGDGGSGGDPQGNGQSTTALLGKFLRIDVSTDDATYRVPADNPFVDGPYRPEVWGIGFRNPWRWSFDRATGELWAGDVGQGKYEEVDLVRKGGNYGWNIREGAHCFPPEQQNCQTAGLIDPVVEYGREDGQSITGGHVYRGAAIPGLAGRFVYGDFLSGKIWAVFAGDQGGSEGRLLLSSGKSISAFGQDNDGEIYVVHYAGEIYRMVPTGPPAPDTFPRKLSQTGCMEDGDVARPGPGLISYTVNSPLWSDGAAKERWFALPEGGRIDIAADGDLRFPVGTVIVKQFRVGDRPIETRLLVHHDDGDWGGYSYEWDEDGRDATLLPASKVKTFGELRWLYPGREDCMRCHTRAAGRTLGPELGQLDGVHDYANGRIAPQLDTLAHIDVLSGPVPELSPLPAPDDASAALELRARAILHANCSHCHRPNGGGRGDADYRFTTPLAAMKICNVMPQHGALGIADARMLAPGAPDRSVIVARMESLGGERMPPLATSVVDRSSVAIVKEWIRSLQGCP